MPLQDHPVLLCGDCDPQRAEVPVVLEIPWLAVDVFANILGEIPGQFDRGGSRPWPPYVDLPLCLAHDRSQIPNLNPRNTGEVFTIVGNDFSKSLRFHMEGVVRIHKIDVRVDIQI